MRCVNSKAQEESHRLGGYRSQERFTLKVWIALILSAVAGFVDTMGFVSLAHIYSANMTGNTVSLALGWAHHSWELVFRRGLPLPSFFIGLVCSRKLMMAFEHRGIAWAGSLPLMFEALFLLLVLLLGRDYISNGKVEHVPTLTYAVLVFLISSAMGLQNAILSHVGPLTVRTTHVTGTLSECADELAEGNFRKAGFYGTLWAFYLAGAVPGAFLVFSIGYVALGIPIAILTLLTLVNFIWPVLRRFPAPG